MGLHFGSDVEIARRSAHSAGISFAGDAQAGTVASTRGDADFNSFGVGDASFAAAGGTHVAQLSGTAAAGAREIKFHGAGHLADMSGTLALGTSDFPGAGGAGAVA